MDDGGWRRTIFPRWRTVIEGKCFRRNPGVLSEPSCAAGLRLYRPTSISGLQLLAPAGAPARAFQTSGGGDISMMDAAGGLIIGAGSPSQRNYQSASVCSRPRWEEPPSLTSCWEAFLLHPGRCEFYRVVRLVRGRMELGNVSLIVWLGAHPSC